MGSVPENAVIPEPVEAKASSPAVPAGSTTEGTVARGGTPSPPRGDGSALPKMDGVNAPNSPSQVAATTPPGTPGGEAEPNMGVVPEERVSKKQRT